ncbi:hypothetical protein [Flavobacteriaceae bacterium 14752]|uniref:hypothetical protein n=1 Tax=Mesohalobacter salilacus TaxID=2491711 RepID=UPI000F64366A|nr:hypothetical protein EIG84_05760 [Flavobacteriaceae bacterium 14752]
MNVSSADITSNTSSESWFGQMIDNLKLDKLKYDTGILNDSQKEFYEAFISDNQTKIHTLTREASSIFFIEKIINAYMEELQNCDSRPKKLAFELSNTKILVWAEIEDNDDVMENHLILTEAKINAKFSQYGFYISTTIVETVDGLEVPEHYNKVSIS